MATLCHRSPWALQKNLHSCYQNTSLQAQNYHSLHTFSSTSTTSQVITFLVFPELHVFSATFKALNAHCNWSWHKLWGLRLRTAERRMPLFSTSTHSLSWKKRTPLISRVMNLLFFGCFLKHRIFPLLYLVIEGSAVNGCWSTGVGVSSNNGGFGGLA